MRNRQRNRESSNVYKAYKHRQCPCCLISTKAEYVELWGIRHRDIEAIDLLMVGYTSLSSPITKVFLDHQLSLLLGRLK